MRGLQEPCAEVAVSGMRHRPWVARRRGGSASVQYRRSREVYGCESVECMGAVDARGCNRHG